MHWASNRYAERFPNGPAPALWCWRLPVVRHVRWFLWYRRVLAHYAAFGEFGYHAGNFSLDSVWLEKIWNGEL